MSLTYELCAAYCNICDTRMVPIRFLLCALETMTEPSHALEEFRKDREAAAMRFLVSSLIVPMTDFVRDIYSEVVSQGSVFCVSV